MEISINESKELFLRNIFLSRSKNTERTYRNGMNCFCSFLKEKEKISTDSNVDKLNEHIFSDLSEWLKRYSVATELLYICIIRNYFEFLEAEEYGSYNIYRIKMLIKNRSRRQGIRLPRFNKNKIESIIKYATSLSEDNIINCRNKALILTLTDTGLRISEACSLKYKNIDWDTGKAIIIGKGDKEAIVRFSTRSLLALRTYFSFRKYITPNSYLFVRHDRGNNKNSLPITSKTGRFIIAKSVAETLGREEIGSVTPHSFRHYFVTNVLQKTNNLKIAQELARHSSIAMTQRYSHFSDNELDNAYISVFN